jgi:hypothetical protein
MKTIFTFIALAVCLILLIATISLASKDSSDEKGMEVFIIIASIFSLIEISMEF